jgi:hypothetical protein
MKEIPLGGKYGLGKVALVDDEDFERLSKYHWTVDLIGVNSKAVCHAVGHVDGRTTMMHTVIKGRMPGMVIHHINGDGLDNRKENLSYCTNSENTKMYFAAKKNKDTSKGV